MNTTIHISDSPLAVAEDFADYFASEVVKKPYFVALSGGSTPKILFKLLAEKYSDSIDWSNIFFFWGDERCVDPEDAESNFKMAKELLFDHIDIPLSNIHRVHGEEAPAQEADRYGQKLTELLPSKNGWPVFDMVILGMGDDGHTASIFPHQMDLLGSEKVAEVAAHPSSGQKRVTLTGKVINHAEQVVFLVTGENKRTILTEIIRNSGSAESYPASYIKPEGGNLHWFTDIDVM
jgi:6-phosphogluconolactonase